MSIKIKYRDPKATELSKNDLVVNVKEGSLFFKSNLGIHKVTSTISVATTTTNVSTGNIGNSQDQEILFNNAGQIDGDSLLKFDSSTDTVEIGRKINLNNEISLNYSPTTPTGSTTNIGRTVNAPGFKIQTTYGSTDIGAVFYGGSYFFTDTSRFIFDKKIIIDAGLLSSQDTSLTLRAGSNAYLNQDKAQIQLGISQAITTVWGDINTVSNTSNQLTGCATAPGGGNINAAGDINAGGNIRAGGDSGGGFFVIRDQNGQEFDIIIDNGQLALQPHCGNSGSGA